MRSDFNGGSEEIDRVVVVVVVYMTINTQYNTQMQCYINVNLRVSCWLNVSLNPLVFSLLSLPGTKTSKIKHAKQITSTYTQIYTHLQSPIPHLLLHTSTQTMDVVSQALEKAKSK